MKMWKGEPERVCRRVPPLLILGEGPGGEVNPALCLRFFQRPMQKLYQELATWWPLISPPTEYVEEAAFFLPLLAEQTANPSATLLELGSGGGNNAFHIKSSFASVTLADLSPEMLAVSAALNPDCEHVQGDLRTLRLGRTFDVVFVHDAIDNMTTLDELQQALETVFIHC